MARDPKDQLLSVLREMAPREVGALAGALGLVPANGHHQVQLEGLAMLAAAGKARGSRRVSRSRARKMVNGPLREWLGFLEDPAEWLGTEAFTFNGGTHVFVGPEAGALDGLRQAAAVVAAGHELSNGFQRRATGIIQGGCALSDRAVDRAGLSRNLPLPEYQEELSVPPKSDLARLMEAVRVSRDEVSKLQRRTMLEDADLDALTSKVGSVPLPDPPLGDDVLSRRPLLAMANGEHLLAAPHRLPEALLHRLLGAADELGELETFAERLHESHWYKLDQTLGRFGMKLVVRPRRAATPLSQSYASHGVYQFDSGKAMHVALYSDRGREHDEAAPEELRVELTAAREKIATMMSSAEPAINGWLSLVVLGPSVCRKLVAFDAPTADQPGVLIFNLADLEAIAAAEARFRDPLLLWKYHAALREVEKRGRLVSFQPLDAYATWRDRERCFPTSRAGPLMVTITPGAGLGVRQEAVRNLDVHAVPGPDPTTAIEVVIGEEGPSLPIYTTRGLFAGKPRMAVEFSPGPVVWVLSDAPVPEPQARVWFETARMIAFWVAEFGTALQAQFAELEVTHPVLVVDVSYEDTAAPAPGYTIVVASGRVGVQSTPQFIGSYDDTNQAEREFARALIIGLLEAAGVTAGAEIVDGVIDDVAPPGVKRMCHAIRTNRLPAFIGSLPSAREPHPADLWIRRQRLLDANPLDEPQSGRGAIGWLNAAVGCCFQMLRDQVAGLDGATLLQRLLINNEALVRNDAIRGATLPSRLACFKNDEALVDEILDEFPRNATASLATRFLIELVAANPPAGTSMPSDQELDDLLAMAATIVRFGIASDVARFDLAEVSVELVNGDVHVSQGSYDEASLTTLMAIHAATVGRERGRVQLRSELREPDEAEPVHPGEPVTSIDRAAVCEFGVTLTELTMLYGEAVALAQEAEQSLVRMKLRDLRKRLSRRLKWDMAKVDRALTELLLPPRADYLNAPEGFKSSDIWPWKFNRGLSYIRRPLVEVGKGNDSEVWFTPGHVSAAAHNLVGLITTARYKARSRELQKAMGPLKEGTSKEFTRRVGDVMADLGFQVRLEVTKVGALKLEGDDRRDLGDLDVLAVDIESKRVLGLECKDFEQARVPHEVSHDLRELFKEDGKKRCVQVKHELRLEWVRQNLKAVLASFGIDDPDDTQWTVHGAFVFSVPLISPLLGLARLPWLSLEQLQAGDLAYRAVEAADTAS